MAEVATWRPDETEPAIQPEAIVRQAQAFDRKRAADWERAGMRAAEMLVTAKPDEHGYLMRKGLRKERGLVLPDGALMVPMRDVLTDHLVGAQVIRWDADERQWTKKMLPGMRAKGAVLRIGPHRASEHWLCEGYATAITIRLALDAARLPAAVVCCFSDVNLVHVSQVLASRPGRRFVFADNDASGAGKRAAERTGLPWCMADDEGDDANDLMVKSGLLAVSAKAMEARAMEPVP